jgi:hypothetical protein
VVRYIIWGWAAVFDVDGEEVTDRAVLGQLAGFVDADDLLATDYIGGTPEEDAVADALEPSGRLRFALRDGEAMLRVFNEYVARRPLTAEQLRWLAEYTSGQWSDGMGESIFVPGGPFKDYKLQPLDQHEVDASDYPFIHVASPEHDA